MNNREGVPSWVWTLVVLLVWGLVIVAIGVFNDHRRFDPADNYVSPQCNQAADC